jgi:methyltransferase (TIGR00027 family)
MRDVAAGLDFQPDPKMARYLRARTAFFDRVVLNAAGRGVTQLVSLGAGYDGRSLRYSEPDRRWFEVDHPATSRDKQARVTRLRAAAAQVVPEPTFVAWDFSRPGLAEALVAAGFDPDIPAQMISEGVAVYLEPEVLESLLGEARALAAPGTRLAISLSVGTVSADRRARFRAGVGRLGEPVRSPPLTVPGATRLFEATGWQTVDISEKSASAGLCVLRPIWTRHRRPPTIGRTGRFMEGMLHRERSGDLAAHLERT